MIIKSFTDISKKWYIGIVLLLLCISVLCVVFFSHSTSNKKFEKVSSVEADTSATGASMKIKELPGITFDNITSIGLQYDSMKYPAVTVKDSEKIKEFINRLDKCTIRKRAKQENVSGYYLVADFSSGGNRVFDILFMGDFIEINFPGGSDGTQYIITDGDISTKELDQFVLSVK